MRFRLLASPVLAVVLFAGAAIGITGCDGGEADRVVGGVNVSELFAAPTDAEKAAVLAEWQTRDVSPKNVQVVSTLTATGTGVEGTTRTFTATVVSHEVAGVTHYGAVLVPAGTPPGTRLPVVVYAHGGDAGARVEEGAVIAGLLTPPQRSFIWIVPSFRAERLRFGSNTRTSGGPASPWDYDVDDALALVNVAVASYGGDPNAIAAVGLSRGGGVALLMGVRDPRVRRVLDLFGPTDFFGAYVENIVADALGGGTRNLPGFDVLNARFVQPLKAGTVSDAQMRAELLRRSPARFADRLPAVQVQHGTADDVVDVSQARALIDALRGRTDATSFLWEGGRHDPTTFPLNWIGEAQRFLEPLGAAATVPTAPVVPEGVLSPAVAAALRAASATP